MIEPWGFSRIPQRAIRLIAITIVLSSVNTFAADLPLWLPGPGMGLGYGVVVDRGKAATPLSEGAAYWGGAYCAQWDIAPGRTKFCTCTLSWFDPQQELVGVLMTQVRPYGHINIRQDFQVLAYQAIVE